MHILTISSERSAFLDEACGGNQDIRHAARTVLILDANARMSVLKNVRKSVSVKNQVGNVS